jgi:hypothetical protein
MGIISREEMERRLMDPNNLIVMREQLRQKSETPVPSQEIIEHKRSGSGRTPGSLNRTDFERAAIGELSTLTGPTEAAKLTGASISQAHSYSKGFNTSGHRLPNGELGLSVQSMADSIEAVKARAIEKILECMELITPEKLDNSSPVAISQVAMNLSKVAPNLENKVADINQNSTATVVIYSPPVSEESRYKTIKVS